MERNFRVNWQTIIEEAKQRRKSQKLTQARLAELAGVSTPTISRFENDEKDIQLSSVISILSVLGLVDHRKLIFPKPDAHYDQMQMAVWFKGKDGDKEVLCGISRAALDDHFDGDNKDKLKVFIANRGAIEQETRRKYFSGKLEPDGSILIRTEEL